MYARTISGAIVPGRADDAIRVYNEQVLPLIKQQSGLVSSLLLVDRAGGKATAVTVWETEEALTSTGEGTKYLAEALGLLRGLVVPNTFAHWEVGGSA